MVFRSQRMAEKAICQNLAFLWYFNDNFFVAHSAPDIYTIKSIFSPSNAVSTIKFT